MNESQQQEHTAVLREEAVSALAVQANGFYVDATYGRGGHSKAILEKLGAAGRLLVFDKDPEAISHARALQEQDDRVRVAAAPFSELLAEVTHHERDTDTDGTETHDTDSQSTEVQGVLFDLGVSSPQLDAAERGFSFLRNGPLDMRMNPDAGESAADWINRAEESEIADVLFHYGEERHARRMARRIVKERQTQAITTTEQLANIVKAANPTWERDKHPATRAFQAVRIHINDELEELRQGLEQALTVLASGGRLVVISFHSLEDRLVKKFIATQTKGDSYPRDLPIPQSMLNPRMKPVGKPLKAGTAETESNPRARSAIMRVAEKL
ncbi:MAG: 16S rRNA (cytosine(1402)-N(4))-methyltransferase RsmH [Pseudohongiellaceae bacterium]